MTKRFIVLDGSSLLYRAFYALPPLTDSKGEPTNAIYGFSNMLTKLLSEYEPDYLALAFDKSKKTFRTERFPAYKGTRDKTPEELLAQIPLFHEMADAFGLNLIEKERYEADDIIGTLATQAAAQGFDVLVVTGDRDALQLVRPNLRVLMTKKGITELKVYDEAAFTEEYGIEPIRLIDLKGLQGDTSDNIPGVPGVGPKTATKLLLAYGTLEGVYEHLAEIRGKKLKSNLEENHEQAILSKELATIELAVPDLVFDAETFTMTPRQDAARAFCERYELRTVWKNYQKIFAPKEDLFPEQPQAPAAELHWENWDKVDGSYPWDGVNEAAIAASFTGSVPFEQLTSIAVSLPDGQNGIVHRRSAAFPVLLDAIDAMSDVTLFGLKRYYHAGLKPENRYFDVEIAAYLLQPELSKYELGRIAAAYLSSESVPESFDSEEAELAWTAQTLRKLAPVLRNTLQDNGLTKLYETTELPLVAVLSAMEKHGVYVNREHLETEKTEVGKRIDALRQTIYDLAGTEFNINSTKQLGEILFDKLGLPPIKKTKTGYSTNAEVLEKLRFAHPIIEEILAYRLWTKLKSTYLDGIGDLISSESGRVHTQFNQTVTATGRLSSSDPNLQNIPVRTEEGKTIRALFEPGEGYDYLLSADYSQIELRLLAHLSGDVNFVDAFRHNQDIHARTAAEVFGIPLEDVTPEMRRHAKAVNFGIVYGISDFGLAKNLNITRREAADYIDRYFTRYPGVKSFLDGLVAEAHKTGAVTTMFGRRRELQAIKSRNFNQRSLAERMAMNTPIQGSAADIIKLAMIAAYGRLQEEELKSRILLQVHDELVLEITKSERERVEAILRETMEHVVELKVPLPIDIHYGKNWAEAK